MADMLQPNRAFIYINGSKIGDVIPEEDMAIKKYPECEIQFKFSQHLVKKASDYSVALTRFEVPLQFMAPIPEFVNAITINSFTNGQPQNDPVSGDPIIVDTFTLPPSFSLFQAQQHIRGFCNNRDGDDGQGNNVEHFRIYLTPDLRWRVDGTNDFFWNHQVIFSEPFSRWLSMAKRTWAPAQFFAQAPALLDELFLIDNEHIELSYCSIADTFHSIRRINFSSDLFLQMEFSSSSGNAGSRIMTDFIMPKQAAISYALNSGSFTDSTASVAEYLPQTVTYTGPPMHGRWSPLLTDQPIFNFRVRATAVCFDWETMALVEKRIPIPPGQEFSIKLLFATRSEVPVQES